MTKTDIEVRTRARRGETGRRFSSTPNVALARAATPAAR